MIKYLPFACLEQRPTLIMYELGLLFMLLISFRVLFFRDQPRIKSSLLRAMKSRLKERTAVPVPILRENSCCAQHLAGLALETSYGAIDQERSSLQICARCRASLERDSDKPPRLSLANFLSRGSCPPELSGLTWVERRLISMFRASLYILTLQGHRKPRLPDSIPVQSDLDPKDKDNLQQWKLRGHCIGMLELSLFLYSNRHNCSLSRTAACVVGAFPCDTHHFAAET